jgi:RNA polymerase sigma-32 factor
MGTTASQKKLFFNLRRAKSQISALEELDLHPDQVKKIAKRLGVSEQDVIDMNRRMAGDASLNSPLRDKGEGERQDWLVDDAASRKSLLSSTRRPITGSKRSKVRWASSMPASGASSRRRGLPMTR